MRLTYTRFMNKNIPLSVTPSLVMGCILSWLRQQSGLDQRSMAKFIGITQASWSRIENGHAVANFEQILSSCSAMNIDFVYVAKLYDYINRQLELKSVIVSSSLGQEINADIKKIVKETISAHALSVSKKALNSDA